MSSISSANTGEKKPFTSILRVLARSPTAIDERRHVLLQNRDSIDIESQASSSGSTLLGTDQEDDEDEEWNEKRRMSTPVTENPTPAQDSTTSPRQRIDARIISDAIIGLSDGLTVPFALTAGLSALGSPRTVIFAGLAELIAGSISMGLGGYFGAVSEESSHRANVRDTQKLVAHDSVAAAASLETLLAPFELPPSLLTDITTHMSSKQERLVNFLMHFEHHASTEPEKSRAFVCALTIAAGYAIGGGVPLLPYFFVDANAEGAVTHALLWSIAVMVVCLGVFGYSKTCFVSGWRGRENVWQGIVGGLQMIVVGGLAAGIAMGTVRFFDSLAAQS